MQRVSPEGPLSLVLERLADLVLLNLAVLLLALPWYILLFLLGGLIPLHPVSISISLLTLFAGNAYGALHDSLMRMARGEGGSVLIQFFRAYRAGFGKTFLLWLILLSGFAVLWLDTAILANLGNTFGSVLSGVCTALFIFWSMVSLYVFPLQARYENPVRVTLKNAVLVCIYAFPRSVLMFVIQTVGYILLFFFGIYVFPFYLLFGISLPAYFCMLLYMPVWKRLEERADHARPKEGDAP